MPVNLTCPTCKKMFSVPPSRQHTAKYCSNDCRPKAPRAIRPDGYIWIRMPDHPDAHVGGTIAEHRLVAEKIVGRRLHPNEDVHHLNGDRADNRPENLRIMTHAEHTRLHAVIERWARGFDVCQDCGTTQHPHTARGLCQRCYDRKRRPRIGPEPFDWSLKHPHCVDCGTTNRKHYALGLCTLCYERQRIR